jgi:hypothetical protein
MAAEEWMRLDASLESGSGLELQGSKGMETR